MPFTITRLGALDLDRAAALHAEAFAPIGERAWTRQDLAGLMASPGVAGMFIRTDGRDAGFVLCRVAADEAELLTIAVRPTDRRRGAGRRLLKAVVEHVREAGARTLFLEVSMDNPAARSLYETEGFCEVGRRRAYYKRGDKPAVDGVIMRLGLN